MGKGENDHTKGSGQVKDGTGYGPWGSMTFGKSQEWKAKLRAARQGKTPAAGHPYDASAQTRRLLSERGREFYGTAYLEERVIAKIAEDPSKKTTQMAGELGAGRDTVYRYLKRLGYARDRAGLLRKVSISD